jgi:pimeloyl-ACP methyl ester carboxylesterase
MCVARPDDGSDCLPAEAHARCTRHTGGMGVADGAARHHLARRFRGRTTRVVGTGALAHRAGVLILHGKGRNRAEMAPLGRSLQEAGFSVLIPDYRGYGGTDGTPTTDGVFADAALSYNSLRLRLGDTLTPVVILGHSMGTALAARLSREHTPAATVYMSPFTRISDLVRSRAGAIGPRLFDTTSFAFNPIDDAAKSRSRTLVVVAGRDALIRKPISDAFIAGLTPVPAVIRDRRATHNSVLESDSTIRAVTDSLVAWVPCVDSAHASRTRGH